MEGGEVMGEYVQETYELDTREKLEADIRKLYSYTTSTLLYPQSEKKTTDYIMSVSVDTVLEWLDRQAAITQDELQANADDLQAQLESAHRDWLEDVGEYEERIAELQSQLDNSMPLPLDADGEPIHMGDILHSDEIGIDFECQGVSIDMRGNGRREHWTVCYQVTDGISDWTAAKRCHHVKPKRQKYSDILESFVHAYNLFMYASTSVSEFKSKEELFDKYIDKIKEVER